MKDIISKINEGAKESVIEVDNMVDKTGEYHTFDYNHMTKKFKYGFIETLEDYNSFAICGMNSSKEYGELLQLKEEDQYDFVEKMKIGETRNGVTRIW